MGGVGGEGEEGGRGGERGEGREHLWTRELVVYTEVKIKAAVVNEIDPSRTSTWVS